MRFLYAFAALLLWWFAAAECISHGLVISDEILWFSFAVVYAGALAGGD